MFLSCFAFFPRLSAFSCTNPTIPCTGSQGVGNGALRNEGDCSATSILVIQTRDGERVIFDSGIAIAISGRTSFASGRSDFRNMGLSPCILGR